jgi:hypothetical protein
MVVKVNSSSANINAPNKAPNSATGIYFNAIIKGQSSWQLFGLEQSPTIKALALTPPPITSNNFRRAKPCKKTLSKLIFC